MRIWSWSEAFWIVFSILSKTCSMLRGGTGIVPMVTCLRIGDDACVVVNRLFGLLGWISPDCRGIMLDVPNPRV